jgi:hypothetical protein
MGRQNKGKLNNLLKKWPRGTVATQHFFNSLDIYRQLTHKYVQGDWIKRFGAGAYVRSGESVGLWGGLYALQAQLKMTAHIGGRTALELTGRSHFIPLGATIKVRLVSDGPEQLPAWFRRHAWESGVEHRCLSLFTRVPAQAITRLECGGFSVTMSSAERAIMEEMRLVRNNDNVKHVCQLMDGLTTLRPRVVQELLGCCRSDKVKRLFLWCAERVGHPWWERLDAARIDIGKGKRVLFRNGQFDRKYRITVPRREELPRV